MKYSELLKTGKFQMSGEHLVLVGGGYPYSISEDEFNFLKDFIVEHKLKRGYELATGFGISALAAGMGMKENYGEIVSVDSYAEGETQNLKPDSDETYPQAECLVVANYLMNKFKMDNVHLEVGISPRDTIKILDKYPPWAKHLDYVFIDGCHTSECVRADIKVLEGRVGGYMFFHDISNSTLYSAIEAQLKESFGATIEKVSGNLGMAKI